MPAPVKKLIIMNILDILRRYSDEDHRLSQKDIVEILHREYDMTVERKTVRRNLLNLIDCGYDIEYSESIRMTPNRITGELEESYIWSDFYLVRDFTDSELRLLIDGLLFSKHIPYSQCKELVGKLEKLSNVYFSSRVKLIRTMPDTMPPNKQLFYTIEVIDEAITHNKQILFHYDDSNIGEKVSFPTAGVVRHYSEVREKWSQFFDKMAASFGYDKEHAREFYDQICFGNYVDVFCGIGDSNAKHYAQLNTMTRRLQRKCPLKS